MFISKDRMQKIVRILITALFISAFFISPLSDSLQTAAASSDQGSDGITPGLRAAIQEDLGFNAFTPANETAKLTASDAAAGDLFGWSVSVSGDTALVGAFETDFIGSAYIFERDQGGLDNWGQVKKLTAGVENGYFGISVALSGDTALVGAYWDDGNGSAYIFERDQGGAENWGQVKKLTASDAAAGDELGISVALSGDTALVGARYDDDNGSASGSAYIFERDQGGADNWGEAKKLTASDGAADDNFGTSVALSGDTALIGARNNDDNGTDSGSAYIYERDQGGAGNWGEAAKLTASDAAMDDYFGISVALSEDTVLVAAYANDDAGTNSGSAYIYYRNQGGADNWGHVKKLNASDAAGGDEFGFSVALSGDTALVGVRYDDDNGLDSGSAYIFERDQGGSDNWGEATKLTASDGETIDLFGHSVAISGDTVLVGAYANNDSGNNSGSAYVDSPYLSNGSFENPLGAEWNEIVTGNGDGRVLLNQAYAGSYIYLFKANGGLEIIKQTVAQSGIAGDEYTLTLYFGGKDVSLSGKLGARFILKNGGVKVDKKTCIHTPSGPSFSWAELTCTITASGAFDRIEVLIGIQKVSTGMVGVDAAILNKTGP